MTGPRLRRPDASTVSPGIRTSLDPNARPILLFEDELAGVRLVRVGAAVVVEIPDGRDSTGRVRWQRARLVPQRQQHVVVEGWKAIMAALGCDKIDTAVRYARRTVDPLPVRYGPRGNVWIFELLLQAWVAANTSPGKLRFFAAKPKKSRKPPRTSET